MKKSMGDGLSLLAIKTEITALALARFDLGRELYKGHKQNNKWRRRPESMTSYLRFIATCYPELSLRNYSRHYRVYQKLIVESKLSIFKLKDIDFNMLVTVAECEALSPWQRWHILESVHAYIQSGWSKKNIRRELREYIFEKRHPNPYWKAQDPRSDEEIVAELCNTPKRKQKGSYQSPA